MKKWLSQEVLVIAVLTLTISLVWIYLSIHQALKKPEKPLLTPQETRVLNPKLDQTVFDDLDKRID